ncbi:MAG: S8 family serine peptidase [Acidobacteriota bacterium]
MRWLNLLMILLLAAPALPLMAQELKVEALRQIDQILTLKRSRTAAQHKIDSRLLMELRQRRGEGLRGRLPQLRMGARVQADGTVRVDLAAQVSPQLLSRIAELGGRVLSSHPRFEAVRADLPLEALEALAGMPAVRSVRPADVMITQMINTTEGDVAHGTDTARLDFGVDGSGVRVGAMSDSVDALVSLQGSGDLPAGVTVLPGQSGNPGTSEGTALLEIVHDMAPGADLFFATGAGGQAQMAQNILDLAAAGCNVIVDDVLYLTEPVFQDGIIAQAVNEVAAAGVFYYSSAGNSGNLDSGTAGVWEGDYSGIALPGPLAGNGQSAHDFGGGTNNNEITFDSPSLVTLQWADPFGAASNDYDLFILDAALANVLDASTNTQNGTQNPVEAVDSIADDDTGNRVVVVLFDGVSRFIHVNTHRGRLASGTDGQVFGHPAAEGAMAVGAVNVATAGGGVFTGGPANPVQTFSSDGPRRIFFEADGTPVAPAVATAVDPGDEPLGAPMPEVRQKPDVSAADGVSTATPGFNPFFGSSASAPHVAGLAALLKELMPSLNSEGAENRVKEGSADIESPGMDNLTGVGLPIGTDVLDGAQGFDEDIFDFLLKLGENGNCSSPHTSGTGDNEVLFDGLDELLDPYTNGTQPFVFEFETDANDSDGFTGEITAKSDNGEDLFPDGFEDPDSGTPLDAACIEIGIDDTLDSDEEVLVSSAMVEFFNDGTGLFGGPIDITSSFSNPFDGRLSIIFPGLAGQDIDEVRLTMDVQSKDIFADGFESGDASSWTDQVP